MATLSADEKRKLEEQIQEQDEETYGTEHTDGGEVFSDTDKMVEEVTGNETDPLKRDFNDEVNDDEKAISEGADQQDEDELDEDL